MAEPPTLAEIYADLGAIREIAIALDVRVERVKQWVRMREKTRCPLPVFTLSTGAVYSIADWKAWFKWWAAKKRPHSNLPNIAVKGRGRYQPPARKAPKH